MQRIAVVFLGGALLAGCRCDPQIIDAFDAGCVPEICDGLDNDCDGEVDNGFVELSCGVGACGRVVASCEDGQVQTCVEGEPTQEVCNGIDDDCDGEVDEGYGDITCGVGACERTVSACTGGSSNACVPGEALPGEFCNGIDDNCNGDVDEGFGQISCGAGVCPVSACDNGVTGVCDPDNLCTPPVCGASQTARVGEPEAISAQAFGDATDYTWTVTSSPAGSVAVPFPTNAADTSFTADLPGTYTLRFCATDASGTSCCNTSLFANQCESPPSPPASTACVTSWDGRPIIQFADDAGVPAGQTYQLQAAGNSTVLATAFPGANHVRPASRIAAGGPPPGQSMTLELRACVSGEDGCCSEPTLVPVTIVEECASSVAPMATNLVISEYIVNGTSPNQHGEAIELTNLSNCPLSLDGSHFGYRNAAASPASYRWMNFGAAEIVPPRGVYVAMRSQATAGVCATALNATTQSPGLFGLKISTLAMEGDNLDSGWFNDTGGGSSILQVAAGHVNGSTISFDGGYIARVAPYQSQSGGSSCHGVGFDALNSCGGFPGTTTPTTALNPNQLGRLWHPCDAVANPVPACIRD